MFDYPKSEPFRREPLCSLRPVMAGDLEWMRRLRNRSDTRCWLGDDREISEAMQNEWWMKHRGAGYQVAGFGAVENVGVVRASVDGDRGFVGADLDPLYRGRGFGHTIFRAACHHVESLGAKELHLRVFLQNTAAVKIYLAAGFRFSAVDRVEEMEREVPSLGNVSLHYASMTRGSQ